jgi:hypothetical protein
VVVDSVFTGSLGIGPAHGVLERRSQV